MGASPFDFFGTNSFIGDFFCATAIPHVSVKYTHLQSAIFPTFMGNQSLGIFQPRLADNFPVPTAVTRKTSSSQLLPHDAQMHMKMAFPMGVISRDLDLMTWRSVNQDFVMKQFAHVNQSG